jgi:CheY-like chemotaxis protein
MEGKMVLIVDDDDSGRCVCARYLERKGWEILEAQDGLEGVEIAREKKPDLILMDVDMPHMNGFEALDQLRTDPDTQEIPVIIMSSDSDSYEQKASAHNCPFLGKPIRFEDLLQKIAMI